MPFFALRPHPEMPFLVFGYPTHCFALGTPYTNATGGTAQQYTSFLRVYTSEGCPCRYFPVSPKAKERPLEVVINKRDVRGEAKWCVYARRRGHSVDKWTLSIVYEWPLYQLEHISAHGRSIFIERPCSATVYVHTLEKLSRGQRVTRIRKRHVQAKESPCSWLHIYTHTTRASTSDPRLCNAIFISRKSNGTATRRYTVTVYIYILHMHHQSKRWPFATFLCSMTRI